MRSLFPTVGQLTPGTLQQSYHRHLPRIVTALKRYYNCHTTAIKHATCKLQQILLQLQVLWQLYQVVLQVLICSVQVACFVAVEWQL